MSFLPIVRLRDHTNLDFLSVQADEKETEDGVSEDVRKLEERYYEQVAYDGIISAFM